MGSAARSTIGRSELPARPPGPARAGLGGEVPRSRSGQEIQPSRCRCRCPSVPASLCGIVAIEHRGLLLRHVAARFWRGGPRRDVVSSRCYAERSMGPIARGGSSAKVASRPPRTEPPFLMARDTITRWCRHAPSLRRRTARRLLLRGPNDHHDLHLRSRDPNPFDIVERVTLPALVEPPRMRQE